MPVLELEFVREETGSVQYERQRSFKTVYHQSWSQEAVILDTPNF